MSNFEAEQRAVNAADHHWADMRDLLQQALSVLERDCLQATYAGGVCICNLAIAIRAHLAQPQAEPVAIGKILSEAEMGIAYDRKWGDVVWWNKPPGPALLYTHPAAPAPAEMTREQILDLVKECGLDWHKGFVPLFDDDDTNRYEVLVRAAIEAAHGITAHTKGKP